MRILQPEIFVLTSEEGYFIVDLAGQVLIRARQGEEDLRQYEIDSAQIPAELDSQDLEVEVTFDEDEETVRLTGNHTLAITGSG